MRLYSTVFLMASAAVTLAACGQGSSGPGGNGTTSDNSRPSDARPIGTVTPPNVTEPTAEGEAFFTDKVIPALQNGNLGACTGCHTRGDSSAPTFLVGSGHERYLNVRNYRDGALIQPSATNLLLNKGQHEGPDLSGTQFAVVSDWIKLENPGKSPSAPQNFFDALRSFAKCMNFDQFKNQGLDQLANQVVTGNLTCADCHADPKKGPGLFINNNAQQTFDQLKIFPSVLKLVGAQVAPTGSFVKLQATNRIRDKGIEYVDCSAQDVIKIGFDTQNEDYCHPNYTLNDDLRRKLEDFVRNALNDANNGGLCQGR